MNSLVVIFFTLFLFINTYAQDTYLKGRGTTGQGLWSENNAGLASISKSSIGLSLENKFGLLELTHAQLRAAIPTKIGVIVGHLSSIGDHVYAQNDVGLTLARSLSPHFFMAMTGRYLQHKITPNSRQGLLMDVGIQYAITTKVSTSAGLKNALRDSLEPSIMHTALQYRASSKVTVAVDAQKIESLPLSLQAHIKYFPSPKVGLYAALSFPDTDNAFGMAFIWNYITIDTFMSIHHHLGISPQMAITYRFE